LVTVPQPGHSFATTWYSVTTGGGAGAASNIRRLITPVTATSDRSAPAGPAHHRDAFHPLIGVIGLAQR
jgi:hypothetical protein